MISYSYVIYLLVLRELLIQYIDHVQAIIRSMEDIKQTYVAKYYEL